MECARRLNCCQEAGTITRRAGDETNKVLIAANMRLFPQLEQPSCVADLRCYGDIVVHNAKFGIMSLCAKDVLTSAVHGIKPCLVLEGPTNFNIVARACLVSLENTVYSYRFI